MTPDNGSLGRALETRSDTFETLCGSWAAFKLSRYLMQFTGEARYGDWIERLFYNGAGAALPLRPGGRNFYYSDYRTSGGIKTDYWENFTCCSGTYIQDMADYHNLIYYKDAAGLYVNLYVPSEVIWQHQGSDIKLTQKTDYPAAQTISLVLDMKQSVRFPLRFRVPEWSRGMSIRVNDTAANVACTPGTWAVVERAWNPGDRIEVRVPLRFRMQPVDRHHPNRVAIVRGPLVMAFDFNYYDPDFRVPDNDDDLNKWLVPFRWPRRAVYSAYRTRRVSNSGTRWPQPRPEIPALLSVRRRLPVLDVHRYQSLARGALVTVNSKIQPERELEYSWVADDPLQLTEHG